MERTDILELMSTLKLYGMRAVYDEVMATGIKRRHEPPRIVGDLLSAEIAEKQARSIKYQLTIAKLPLAKDIDNFDFTGTPVNQALVRDLASGAFLAEQRNAVLIGGTGTGKSHLAIAIARACIRSGARGRFYTVVDLVNRLENEARASRQGRLAEYLTRMDFIILDELGYLPFAQTGGQLLFHLISRLYERTEVDPDRETVGSRLLRCSPVDFDVGSDHCQRSGWCNYSVFYFINIKSFVGCGAYGYVDDRLRRPAALPPLPEQARKAGKCSPSPTYPQAPQPTKDLILMK